MRGISLDAATACWGLNRSFKQHRYC